MSKLNLYSIGNLDTSTHQIKLVSALTGLSDRINVIVYDQTNAEHRQKSKLFKSLPFLEIIPENIEEDQINNQTSQIIFEVPVILSFLANLSTSENKESILNGHTLFEQAFADYSINFYQSSLLNLVHSLKRAIFGEIVLDFKTFGAKVNQLKMELNVMEQTLQDKQFFVGNKLSVADIYIFGELQVAFQVILDPKYYVRIPNIIKWFQRCANMTTFQAHFGYTQIYGYPLQPHDPSKVPQRSELSLNLHPSKRNIVLVMTGSFYPIHLNHIRMVEKCIQTLSNHKATAPHSLHIAIAVLMPIHDQSLKHKTPLKAMSASQRLQAVKMLAEQSSELIQVDGTLCMPENNVGVGQGVQQLMKRLGGQAGGSGPNPELELFSIFGFDHLDLVRKRVLKGANMVVVQNRDMHGQGAFDLQKWAQSEEMSQYYGRNLFAVVDEEAQEMSSTTVRKLLAKGEFGQAKKYIGSDLSKYLEKETKAFEWKCEFERKELMAKEIMETVREFESKGVVQIDMEELIDIQNEVDGTPTVLGQGVQGQTRAVSYKGEAVAAKFTKLYSPYQIYQINKQNLKSIKIELEILNIVKHPNVVTMIGIAHNQTEIVTVMELALSLKIQNYLQIVKKSWINGRPPSIWLKIFSDLALGCAAMAKAGVQHRDLTLDNIIMFSCPDKAPITPHEVNDPSLWPTFQDRLTLKVCDFGCACHPGLDISKLLRGSCRHYAPESLKSKENYDEKSDVFMFGVAMWEFLNANKFWNGKDTGKAVENTLKGARPESKVDGPFVDIMGQCWQQDPSARPTFVEVSRLLRDAYKLQTN